MIKTFAIKWEEEILVTSQNKDSLIWYEFAQRELTEEESLELELEQIDNQLVLLNWKIKGGEELVEMWVADEYDKSQIEEMKQSAIEMIKRRLEIKNNFNN